MQPDSAAVTTANASACGQRRAGWLNAREGREGREGRGVPDGALARPDRPKAEPKAVGRRIIGDFSSRACCG
ncbi:hypothetical protein PSP6_580036 [Paraburkholderia tropica]|nr:hypothetical protein PSP6_580036 [Paraburkholderia tropica]